MPIYVQYAGIKGNVTEKGHTDWVAVNSFQFGVGRGIGSPVGKAANRESSAPSISEVWSPRIWTSRRSRGSRRG
jgi:type VI secretion system secreted protein Hcp